MLSLGFAVGRAGRTCMRSLSASSKGKAAGEGEGARTGALPFPSRGRLARVATLAMAGWAGLAGAFGGLLGEKAGEKSSRVDKRSEFAFFGSAKVKFPQNRLGVGRGKPEEDTDRLAVCFLLSGDRSGERAVNRRKGVSPALSAALVRAGAAVPIDRSSHAYTLSPS